MYEIALQPGAGRESTYAASRPAPDLCTADFQYHVMCPDGSVSAFHCIHG